MDTSTVSEPERQSDTTDVRTRLAAAVRDRLPYCMVPSAWTVLPMLPVNVHGELDRPALPPPTTDTVSQGPEQDPVVGRMRKLWESELNIGDITADGSF